MKKISFLLIFLVLLGTFVGCSNSTSSSSSVDNIKIISDEDKTINDNINQDTMDSELDTSLNEEFITDDVEIGDLI